MDVMDLMTALMLYCGDKQDCKRFMAKCVEAKQSYFSKIDEPKAFFECTTRLENGEPPVGKRREVVR